MRLHIRLLTLCTPDYFQGCNAPYVNVPVTGSTTINELRQLIRGDLSRGYVGGSTVEAQLMQADYLPNESQQRYADRLNTAAFAAVNRLKVRRGKRYPFPQLAKDAEDVYAYFKFELEL